ncbi:C-type lectin domain family 2 member D-like [Choloepus didactylus]|uniref:C-type lectin domain family 2 member D-like n=1 Tax=Choloepus didactylus TaxID=27675 RepID=UPI0018A003F6|nr:C-type lectin domain family 2 member D-like [Choloepus didactylus]
MMLNMSLICGGIIVLLWGIFGFPRKFGKAKVVSDQKCSEDATVCPQDWKRINKNCFFLSEREATWANSQADCMIQCGTLAIIHLRNDLESLMEYTEPFAYWFGLSKQNENKIWTWANGDLFINWFHIEEGGDCAFMYKKGISSANCSDARKYICSRKGICT